MRSLARLKYAVLRDDAAKTERRIRGNAIVVDESFREHYFSIMRISMTNAKKNLTALLKSVESGESVTICRRGVPVVDLVRSQNLSRRKPKFGTMRGLIKIHDPNWWKPLSDEDAKKLFGNDWLD